MLVSAWNAMSGGRRVTSAWHRCTLPWAVPTMPATHYSERCSSIRPIKPHVAYSQRNSDGALLPLRIILILPMDFRNPRLLPCPSIQQALLLRPMPVLPILETHPPTNRIYDPWIGRNDRMISPLPPPARTTTTPLLQIPPTHTVTLTLTPATTHLTASTSTAMPPSTNASNSGSSNPSIGTIPSPRTIKPLENFCWDCWCCTLRSGGGSVWIPPGEKAPGITDRGTLTIASTPPSSARLREEAPIRGPNGGGRRTQHLDHNLIPRIRVPIPMLDMIHVHDTMIMIQTPIVIADHLHPPYFPALTREACSVWPSLR
mmetsp:Transcript_32825/g.37992  ORF Transcript_32825/g.37992 Transcript_32825/m.37992 type:complete len:316 (+) Transcript_32825:126-1073(+)